MWLVLLPVACGLRDPASSRAVGPARLPVGPLVIGVWLPAGMDQVRLSERDQARLRALHINWVEWVQRAGGDTVTAESRVMGFCNRYGLRMPVYYEPPGYTPSDKLLDWASRKSIRAHSETALRDRVRALLQRWQGAPGFAGYLIGHENYRKTACAALARVTRVLAEEDGTRPAFSVGRLALYRDQKCFLDALLVEEGPGNVFQQEQYVLRADVPRSGRRLERELMALRRAYDEVCTRVVDRHGRWHAVVQAHAESRDGTPYYRYPSEAELRLEVGLALSRGASGIIYFLYSSGHERVLATNGAVRQERDYAGLVTMDGEPTEEYRAVQRIDTKLCALSRVLAPLYFYAAFPSEEVPAAQPVVGADAGLELALFGTSFHITHLLVVNRNTQEERRATLRISARRVEDAVSGHVLLDSGDRVPGDRVRLRLAPGDFELLRMTGKEPPGGG